jgi:hypothetical protein
MEKRTPVAPTRTVVPALSLLGVAFLSLAFASCAIPLGPGGSPATAELTLGFPSSRDLTSVLAGTTMWSVKATGPNTFINQSIALGETSVTLSALPLGEWTFRISALDANAKSVAWGETKKTLVEGANELAITMDKAIGVGVSITLEPMPAELLPYLNADPLYDMFFAVDLPLGDVSISDCTSITWLFNGIPYTPAEGEVPQDYPNRLLIISEAIPIRGKVTVIVEYEGRYYSAESAYDLGEGSGGY